MYCEGNQKVVWTVSGACPWSRFGNWGASLSNMHGRLQPCTNLVALW